jgi:hypothetical protein
MAAVKGLLGRAPGGLLENMWRGEFNDLLRGAYVGKEPLFDLARLESTSPDGDREPQEWEDRRIPALFPSYTEDGGDLNPGPRLRLVGELRAFLASVR